MLPPFRFRPVPFLATVALVILGLQLASWQTRRAAEKVALQARLEQRGAQAPLVLDGRPVDPDAIDYRRVLVSGAFIPNWTLFLDNRQMDGRTGFIVVAPFKIAGTDRVVLVERGWMARDPGVHDRVPQPPLPTGPQTIEGRAVQHPPRVMALGSAAPLQPNAIVLNLEPAEFARASKLDVLPVFVEQTSPDAPAAAGATQPQPQPQAELLRKWAPPALDADHHRGYAFQWYGLTVMVVLFYVITGFRRASKPG